MFTLFHLFGSFYSVTLAESITLMFVHFKDIDTCNPCTDEQRLVQGQTRPDESASPPSSTGKFFHGQCQMIEPLQSNLVLLHCCPPAWHSSSWRRLNQLSQSHVSRSADEGQERREKSTSEALLATTEDKRPRAVSSWVRAAVEKKCDQRGDEDAHERTCRLRTLTLWIPSFSFLPLVGRCTTPQ